VERRSRFAREFLEHSWIVFGMHYHEHIAEVLCGSAKQARTSDVDLLDQVIERCIGILRRFSKRIEINDDEIDWADAVHTDSVDVVRAVSTGQNSAKYRGVGRFDAAVKHFRETRWV